MKIVPTVPLTDVSDTAVLSALPEEVRLALSDIAGTAREGLLAMGVAAGLAVMQTMSAVEITAACGPKDKHDLRRTAIRCRRPGFTVDRHQVPRDSRHAPQR